MCKQKIIKGGTDMGTIKKKWLKMILPVLLVVSMVMSQIGPLT